MKISIEAVYRSHGYLVLRRARQILGSEAEAWEITHEVFARWLEKPDSFQGRCAVTTWLYQVTTRRCLNALRDRKRRDKLWQAHIKIDEHSMFSSQAPDPELQSELRELFCILPEELATVAVYAFFDSMSQAEIAQAIGCSRQRVGQLIQRIRVIVTKETTTCPEKETPRAI